METTRNKRPDGAATSDPWREHNVSQLLYFRSLSLRDKFAAVEGMAEVVTVLERMRARRKRDEGRDE